MTSSEGQILIIIIVKAMESITANNQDDICCKCFERTSCLITMLVNEGLDSKIKSQGMDKGRFCVPSNFTTDEFHERPPQGTANVVDPGEKECLAEEDNISLR